jgi:periplasmic protein TonB
MFSANRFNDAATSKAQPRGGRRRGIRTLWVFLLASVAAHGTVLLVLPPLSFDYAVRPADVLEVVLVQIARARPVAVEQAPPEPPLQPIRPTRRKVARARPVTERSARDTAPTVLTLPEPWLDDESAIPAQAPAEPPAAKAGTRTQVASIAPTPPNFSAAYLKNPAPSYPLAARRAGEQGTVTLRVRVTREGLPDRVGVEKTSGSPRLDAAALDAVRSWRFVPAQRGATPIESWILVPVVFRLEDPS